MLTKKVKINKIEVLPATGHLQIQVTVCVLENDKPIQEPVYHRTTLQPGDKISQLYQTLPSGIDEEEIDLVRDISSRVWTPKIIAAHKKRSGEEDDEK